ncbi:D-inositol-3-phosphate glycosyltransferase [Actinoplanes sp. CA-015351]|uniref:D-inositol-3-phosphate glycosyltransferase n=1 Tax=Actinoplanes sp. CA-015351 TaxID=3239897 RepID=UPI003D973AC1
MNVGATSFHTGSGAEAEGVTVASGSGSWPAPTPRRIATLSVHTSPLEQPGTGDAGGMNVYIVEVAKRLAARGVEVEIFTRATASGLPPLVEMSPGVHVRHVTSGPFEGLDKEELPSQLCAFTTGVLRAEAAHPPGYYDLIHSHYWLSGQVGWLARERWGVPHIHTAHTLAKVKNKFIAAGDRPEPRARVIGEEQVIAESDRLVANTRFEAQDLITHYDADPRLVSVVQPGVDLERFRPGDADRARFGLPEHGRIIAFVGRIQPLKAPDVLISALAEMRAAGGSSDAAGGSSDVTVVICGGPSGSGLDRPTSLIELAGSLGVADSVVFLPPQTGADLAALYRAADLVAVPSYNESFGLVALEAQACGTPVVAAAVGGLVTAVQDGISGVLVDGHDPADWARVLERLLDSPAQRHRLAAGAVAHASQFSWDRTADNLLRVYRDAVTEHRALIAARLEGATYAW